ncbi:glycosyltransferase [Elongatibacter sediminis]|uniref:Glycosyltransferase n=1 Tax=Elongatibacter sediminis TaxID=3119006 RepID=A0AAW9RCM2_9GAMM
MNSPFQRILFSTHTARHYMPPPGYAADCVVCGPDYENAFSVDGRVRSLRTPTAAPYDIAALIGSLPAAERPELLLARVDGFMRNQPANLAGVDLPSVLIFGDSHHGTAPLERLIDYATAEPYDFYVVDHKRQHAHWYAEAGLGPLAWIPALLLADDFRQPAGPTRPEACFVGQTGKHHPLRVRLLNAIRSSGLPLQVGRMPQKRAYSTYNRTRISLNCSLNGDLNLRNFEVLAAGGFLLTDRLSTLAGLDDLFTDGQDLVTYDDADDLTGKIRKYLEHSEERDRIAAHGHATVRRLFSLEERTRRLTGLVRDGRIEPANSVLGDRRIGRYASRSGAHFRFRLRIYQWAQELHRRRNGLSVVCSNDSDVRLCCDLADLSRVRLQRDTRSEQDRQLIRQCGLADVVEPVGMPAREEQTGRPVIVLCRAHEALALHDRRAPDAIIVTDFTRDGEPDETAAKSGAGTACSEPRPGDGLAAALAERGLIPDPAVGGVYARRDLADGRPPA